MRKEFPLVFVFLLFVSSGISITLGLSLSNTDGFEVLVKAGDLGVALGYPRLGVQYGASFLGVYGLEGDAVVNLESPSTDSRLILSFGGNFGSVVPRVGAGVELIEPVEVATDTFEVGRYFVRAEISLNLDRLGLAVVWDRYVYSMVRVGGDYTFNYFKINDSPISGNRIALFATLRLPFDRGSIATTFGYILNAGWIRGVEQVGYDIKGFTLSLAIFRDF